MNFVVPKPLKTVFLSSLVFLLAACSTTALPETENEFAYIAHVELSDTDTQASIEAKYGGNAFIFDKESGIAMLGFTQDEGALTSLSTEVNQDALEAPVVNMGGFSAWAGGWSAWAGGWSAWAGGWSAWAGGAPIPAPQENNDLWNQINLAQAHSISRNFGAGIKVAVIDTGIDLAHPLFQGRLAPQSQWKDYVDNDAIPQEAGSGAGYGHGTAVSGIILQVAPKASILPIRVLDSDGKGDLDDVISAIYHAVNSDADVLNISLGSNDFSSSLLQALKYARTHNVYIVASAGNNANLGNTYPAQNAYWDHVHPFLFGVVSVDANDKISSFSNIGYGSTFSAPGEQIFSAYPGAQKGYFNGTSFAAPLVSGSLALGLSEAPSSSRNDLWQALKDGVFRSQSYWETNSEFSKNWTVAIGEGRLDIANFIRSIPNWQAPVSSQAYNYFANAGLEAPLDGWYLNKADRSSAARNGSYSLKVDAYGYAGVHISGLKPNTTYNLVSYGRTTNSDSNSYGYMSVSDYDGTNWFNYSFSSTDYRSKVLRFTTGPNNSSVWIAFTATDASAYFDDILLTEEQ